MIIPDRRKQILDILEEEGEINTTVLSTRLGVTGATIRTDIRALEREGAIVRFHGGIKLPHKMPSYSGENYMVRAVTHVDLKNAIGAKAATLVGSGNTIFMDASSTTFHMIPYLKKVKDVTVITNGIHTAMELQRNSNFKSIIILGGMLRPHSGAIEGLSSKEMIGNGFSADAGLSGDNFFELELKRLCADRAKKIVALIDSTKLGADSASSFIPAEKIDYLVTDSGASPESVALCRAKGIEVLIADV